MNPLLMHELARVEQASRVASLSAHRRRSALMEPLRRRRGQASMAEVEEPAPAVEIFGRRSPDQIPRPMVSEAPVGMTAPWAD